MSKKRKTFVKRGKKTKNQQKFKKVRLFTSLGAFHVTWVLSTILYMAVSFSIKTQTKPKKGEKMQKGEKSKKKREKAKKSKPKKGEKIKNGKKRSDQQNVK